MNKPLIFTSSRFENPYHVSITDRGEISYLILPEDRIYTCKFSPKDTLRQFDRYNPSLNFDQNLSEFRVCLVHIVDSAPWKMLFILPLSALTGDRKIDIIKNCLFLYEQTWNTIAVDPWVEFINHQGRKFKKEFIGGGREFLRIAIADVT